MSLINVAAEKAYKPKEYSGKIILFRAEETDYDNEQGLLAMAQQGVEVHYISGDHDTLLKLPHVQTLANELQKWLNKASRDLPLARLAEVS